MNTLDRPGPDSHSPRQIAILVYPGVQSLDFTGPLEVFAGAQQLIEATGRQRARLRDEAAQRRRRAARDLQRPDRDPAREPRRAPAPIDTLIVAGGHGSRQAAADRALLDWIPQTAATARRTASVCTGAFLLAAAGLLDGRRATTHWASAAELAAPLSGGATWTPSRSSCATGRSGPRPVSPRAWTSRWRSWRKTSTARRR